MVKKLRLVPPGQKPEQPRPFRRPVSPARAREIMEAAQRESWKDEARGIELKISLAQIMMLMEICAGREQWDPAWFRSPTPMQVFLLMYRDDLLELVQIQELESLGLIEILECASRLEARCTEKGVFLVHWWSEHLREILPSAGSTPSKNA